MLQLFAVLKKRQNTELLFQVYESVVRTRQQKLKQDFANLQGVDRDLTEVHKQGHTHFWQDFSTSDWLMEDINKKKQGRKLWMIQNIM